MKIARSEYPRPQFVRNDWINLNGEWEFAFDDDRAGFKDKWYFGQVPLAWRIQVPFAFQSPLSGIGEKDFHDVVWYRRSMQVPDDWNGRRVLLHFGAVDYVAMVWVNGERVIEHTGGHTPFYADITDALVAGDNYIVVRAEDYSKDVTLPRGKQYWLKDSESIFYTRTTGIWQTVWMEPVEETHIQYVQLTPDVDQSAVKLRAVIEDVHPSEDLDLQVEISFAGQRVCKDTYRLKEKNEELTVAVHHTEGGGQAHLWSPETPHLYTIRYTLMRDGRVFDQVDSYFGLRKVSVHDGRVHLNHQPYTLRMVLDQGYFPDGNLTPPSDEAIRRDVELTKAMGFNGARKHQKIEDPRYLYWCDHLGLLVWGEAANAYQYSPEYATRFAKEWQEAIFRDYNHPSIIAWVPLNESWGVPRIREHAMEQQHALAMYHLTKSLDSTRLVISNDGWEHMKSDLCTLHDYEADRDVLTERYATTEHAIHAIRTHQRQTFVGGFVYEDQPIIVSEFGGIAYRKSEWEGWGYSGADNDDDFLQKLKATVEPLLNSSVVDGFCYTQLTDVEQEINGLLTYDRKPKLPVELIRSVIGGKRCIVPCV